MQPRGAARLVLAGLLTGGRIATGATPADTRPKPRPATTLTVRVAPAAVPLGEPATLTARLRPAKAGVRLLVQRRVEGRWVRAGRITTRAGGRAVLRPHTDTAGKLRFRVLRQSP